MSALEQYSPSPAERRLAPRLLLSHIVPIRIARCQGTLIDVSARGARVRHRTAVGRGTTVRLTFSWHQQHFAAMAQVLSSRIVALDGPTYESRLHFGVVPHESEDVLRQIMESIENEDLRRAVDNLQGDGSAAHAVTPAAAATAGFLRCRFLGGRWQKKWTRIADQPEDGFTLPAAVPELDIARLCRSYENIDATAREMLRAMARTIAESR